MVRHIRRNPLITNSITILTCRPNYVATKTFTRGEDGLIREKPYRSGSHFSVLTMDVSGIHDLFECVQVLEQEPSRMIVRGRVKPAFLERHEITRTLHDDPINGKVAMLERVPEGLQWAMFDFDKIDLPVGMTPADGVEMLVQTLPPEFHDVTYCYQLSSSAGVSGVGEREIAATTDAPASKETYTYAGWSKISAHVWFWFSKPQADMARWAKNLIAREGKRILDPATLETVQPNYTARPIFKDMDDPVGDHRSAIVVKDRDEVDLIWIDAPTRYVRVAEYDGAERDYEVGTQVACGDGARIATPSLADRIAEIGTCGEYRYPLKRAIGYYFWYHGSDGRPEEIKQLLWQAFPAGVKDYLQSRHLDGMVRWFASRHQHPPVYQDKRDADAMAQRLVALRKGHPALPDVAADETDALLDTEFTGLVMNYIEGECGQGKTEWLLDLIANHQDRYIVCLPRIDLVRQVLGRLVKKYPNIETTRNYLIETIFTDKENDIRDAEDVSDDKHSDGRSVSEQIQAFRLRVRDAGWRCALYHARGFGARGLGELVRLSGHRR